MSNDSSKWKVLKDEMLEEFKIFNLRKSTRLNPRSGRPFTFVLMNGLDWTNLIALTPQKEVILVQQYRHGSECETLELPGGCIEKSEDPSLSARRELQEETGYKVKTIESLGWVYANPALQSMKLHCFVGFDAELHGSTQLDAGEDIKTIKMPLKEFFGGVRSGKINHALIVAAAGLLALKFPSLLAGETNSP